MAFLLAGILTAAAKSTKRVAADSTESDTYAAELSADVAIPRLPSVFRSCEHPAAWFCTDGPPARSVYWLIGIAAGLVKAWPGAVKQSTATVVIAASLVMIIGPPPGSGSYRKDPPIAYVVG
jgi:hypothetical protein